MRSFLRALAPACLVVACVAAGMAAAQSIAPVATAPNDTVANLAPAVDAVAKLLIAIIGSIAYGFIQSRVKDADARKMILAAVENAVAYGANRVDGALKDHPLNVQTGSAVVAHAIAYMQQTVPDALKRLGFDDVHLAKLVVAKLPGVDGAIPDAAITGIAAATKGQPAPMPSTDAMVAEVLKMVRDSLANGAIKPAPAQPSQ